MVLSVRLLAATRVRGLAVDQESIANVHVVHATVRERLQQPPVEVVDVESEILVGRDDDALRRILRIHPDRRIVGSVAPGRDRGRLERRRDRARRARGRSARVGELRGRDAKGTAHLAPANQLEVAVLAVVVLVGNGEDAFGICAAHRGGRERESLALADAVHLAAGTDLESPLEFSVDAVHRNPFRRDVGDQEERTCRLRPARARGLSLLPRCRRAVRRGPRRCASHPFQARPAAISRRGLRRRSTSWRSHRRRRSIRRPCRAGRFARAARSAAPSAAKSCHCSICPPSVMPRA